MAPPEQGRRGMWSSALAGVGQLLLCARTLAAWRIWWFFKTVVALAPLPFGCNAWKPSSTLPCPVPQGTQACTFRPDTGNAVEVLAFSERAGNLLETEAERCERMARQEAERLEARRAAKEKEIYGGLDFKPQLNPRSLRMAKVRGGRAARQLGTGSLWHCGSGCSFWR